MNPIALSVTFLDGSEKTVEAIAADLLAFETKFDLSIVKLQSDIRLTHLFFLAWHALKRTGETSDEFDKWIESVAMVGEATAKK
jgi:hypothetical protein